MHFIETRVGGTTSRLSPLASRLSPLASRLSPLARGEVRFRALLVAGALVCSAATAFAQNLSLTASPNPGASPLTSTITWAATNLPGALPHYVRITGQGFDAAEDLATSGNRSTIFLNPTSAATQSAYSAALWRFDHPAPFQGNRISQDGYEFSGNPPVEVNAGTSVAFTATSPNVSASGTSWTVGVPVIANCSETSGTSTVTFDIPANCPSGDYDIHVTGQWSDESDWDDANLKLRVNGVPTVRVSTGVTVSLQVTINPDTTSTITASPTSGEAPVSTTISWTAADYGAGYTYHVSGPGFTGVEEVARTGSRAVVAPGLPGQDRISTYSLFVIPKFPEPPSVLPGTLAIGTALIYRVTGNTWGGVKGTDFYQVDASNLATSAVHAGLVATGQARDLTFTIAGTAGETSPGSTRNGVTSTSFSRWNYRSFTIGPAATGTPFLTRTATVTAVDRPTAPTALNYAELTATSVTLVWRASRDQVEVVGYNLYRDGTLVGSTADLVFTDTGRSANTAYAYTVKAVGLGGNLSLASNTLNVTTTQDFSADGDHDGIPDATEGALGTAVNTAAVPETSGQTQQNIHRPNL